MLDFKLGDLVAKFHPNQSMVIQTGIIIKEDPDTFTIQWISFNKNFFMEKEGDIFRELNNSFLLNMVRVNRTNPGHNLSLLNSSYSDDRQAAKTVKSTPEPP